MISLPYIQPSKIQPKEERNTIPKDIMGIYFLYNENYILMYIGKSNNLKSRINQHFLGKSSTEHVAHNFHYFNYAIINDATDREIYETYYINQDKPLLNNEKIFTYSSEYRNPVYNKQAVIDEERNKALQPLAYAALDRHIDLI